MAEAAGESWGGRGMGENRVRAEGRMTEQDVEQFRVLLARLEGSLAADREALLGERAALMAQRAALLAETAGSGG
ncbi:hypothetical protein RMN57_33770 [Kitasatospora sp. CM 4170]|uniref:Uncharacterized protein n=1 Tax=Kitasatospora aburaviensis TaxID=67265 RepID=A0ABW1F455_9ACTN|nr:hypothetical protein [Kitasatospora sp. CM 4170]WNM49307.1 hypothetical protein RMN57_33770 [Kitasatospora sp. CM 4170]